MDERHLPAMRRFAELLGRERRAFERELLRDLQGGSERTMRTRLFADSFVQQLDDAVHRGQAAVFERWLGEAVTGRSVLRPIDAVTRAIPQALRRAALEHAFLPSASAWIAEIEAAIAHATGPAPAERPSAVDEADAAIDRLLAALDECDSLTGEHSRAVGSWCGRISRVLGLGDAECREMARAGRVHDVGKLTLPPGMLLAPRALDDAEWEMMRSHTTRGQEIARIHPVLEPYIPAILLHHERLDGTGYPKRLAGSDIPFQARLVTVADSFNAMIGRRPYRPTFSPAQAVEELRANIGTQFDPDIVLALERMLSV